MRIRACMCVLFASAVSPHACFGQTPTKQQGVPKQKTETFWRRVLRVSGIGASPSTLKGPGDDVEHGQIWIAEIGTGRARKLTSTGGFRSPVFVQGGREILALKGANAVRVSLADGKETSLYSSAGITKLVGVSMDDPDKVLVLARDSDGHPEAAFLSMTSGKVEVLSYDPSSNDDRHMVEHLSGWDRDYGDTSVYINQQTKSGMAGTMSWTDVFLKKGSTAPIDVSNCDGINCGQPSLSPDGRLVAFVRAVGE